MMLKAVLPASLLLCAALATGACNRDQSAEELSKLDQSLAANATDPALVAALEKQISVDAGKLMHAPAPAPKKAPAPAAVGAITLGVLARQQSQAKAGCDLSYGNQWAQRLPADLPLYPRARVSEAAGASSGPCDIRVVTFTTGARLQQVIDFYHTRAVRAGFTAEHLLDGKDHVLGGTRERDDGAYHILARARTGGGTEVDIVANNGR